MLRLTLFFALMSLPVLMAVAANDLAGPKSAWTPREPLALPALTANVSSSAAGCVVVGHHVLADGSSANARVLKGAFVGMDAAQQQTFARSVLDVTANWHFEAADPSRAEAGFRLQTVGLIRAPAGASRVVAGINALPEQLQRVCQIENLAAWGEANAVSVDQARAEHSGQVVVPDPASGLLYWTYKEPLAKPGFPERAIKARVQACVVIGVSVDEQGAVTNLLVLKSDVETERGPNSRIRKLMEDSALVAVAKAHFSPGPDNLARWAAIKQVPIIFETSVSFDRFPRGATNMMERDALESHLRESDDRKRCRKLSKQELANVMQG